VSSLKEAAAFRASHPADCAVMAGGTDIIPLLKDHVYSPAYIVDLKTAGGHDRLECAGGGLAIGCLTKLRTVEISPMVKRDFPAVAQAARYVASTQIRCKGTMAGNICNASPSCDTAPIEIAMNAVYKTIRAKGVGREIAAADFFIGVKKTVIEPDELLSEIFIPELERGESAWYYKLAVRKAMDLAIIGVAAWVKMEGETIADARFAVGGAAPTPIRAFAAEEILRGKKFSDDLLEEAAVAASRCCRPISDVRASAEYRADMVRVFAKRSFKKALELQA
jgi:carbon-monoxide dehydrogenase medium subunit